MEDMGNYGYTLFRTIPFSNADTHIFVIQNAAAFRLLPPNNSLPPPNDSLFPANDSLFGPNNKTENAACQKLYLISLKIKKITVTKIRFRKQLRNGRKQTSAERKHKRQSKGK